MNALFQNPGNENQWITLLFEGVKSNRAGIGNRISIATDGPEGRRTIHYTVGTGGSFGSSSLQMEAGLGKAEKILGLEVYWPASGTTQQFTDVEVNRFYRITEFADEPEPLNRRTFQFNTSSATHAAH